MKQLESDPWLEASQKYTAGMRSSGKITNITDYGAFVELESGIEGLVHVSEMSWTKKNVHPNKIVSAGQEVNVQVLDIDMDKRRISLGIKQTQDNPWSAFAAGHTVGQDIEGEIRNVTEFGLFVGLSGDIDGMVHLSDVSWDDQTEEALKAHKKGDMVKVRILDIDAAKERVALGLKQLTENKVAGALAGIAKGQVVTCTVTAVDDKGIEVQVNETVKGYIKRADLSRERSEQRPDRFAVGEKVDAKVISIDAKKNNLGLSIKQREMDEDKAAMAEFGSTESGASLGDILGAALKDSKK
jgi:small subunit ribosomal protein S1